MLVHTMSRPFAMPTARPTGCLCRSLIGRDAIVWIAGPFSLRLSARSIGLRVRMQGAVDRPRRFGANGGDCVGDPSRVAVDGPCAIPEGAGGLNAPPVDFQMRPSFYARQIFRFPFVFVMTSVSHDAVCNGDVGHARNLLKYLPEKL
jgi:hypothetical protein